MQYCVCSCGAKYRFPDDSAGKKARCRKCGQSFLLENKSRSKRRRQHDGASEKPVSTAAVAAPEPIVETCDDSELSEVHANDAPSRGYWRALAWNFLFPSGPHNLTIFLSIWLVFALVGLIPTPRLLVFRFLLFPLVLLGIWFAAIRANAAEFAAAGSFRLPEIGLTSDLVADLLSPALRWYTSWLLALAPAIAWATYLGYSGINVAFNTLSAIEIALTAGLPGPAADIPLIVLVVLGAIAWPVFGCVLVLGEFRYIWRIPWMIPGILGSWIGYLVTALLATLAIGVFVLSLALSQSTWVSPRGVGGIGFAVLQNVLWAGAEVYTGILAARALGLYFRHFGHRFAADWSYQEE